MAVALREVGAERPPLHPTRVRFLLLSSFFYLYVSFLYNIFQILKVLFDLRLSLRTCINLRVQFLSRNA